MLGRKTPKAQSAMEYLMTYGWAILIIAVVLGALFSLGVFGGGSLVGTACVASPGYLCSSPTLGSNGELAFTFGQNTGSTIYNVQMACVATTNSVGLPSNGAAWSPIATNGLAVTMSGPNTANALGGSGGFVSGQEQAVTGLPCYGTTGIAIGSALNPALSATATIGTSFSGYLFLNYTGTYCSGSGCTWYTVKMATLSLKVV
jgi:hypothetical protein